jgi:hypothetical protein
MATLPKKFGIAGEQIRQLATGHGACTATDMITVHCHRIGYMYRQVPRQQWDSGWVFTAGTESEQFMDDPNNHAIYDVNTVANYDPDIIPLLNTAPPCAFERQNGTGKFIPALPPAAEG